MGTIAKPLAGIDHVTALPESTSERCDRCNADVVARVLVTLDSGLQLTFCGHHAASVGVGPEMIASMVIGEPVSMGDSPITDEV